MTYQRYGRSPVYGPPTIQMPGPQLTVPQPARVFPVSELDWARLRQQVDDLKEPLPWARDTVLVCAGIVVTALLGLLAWVPVSAQLTPTVRADYWWITAIIAALLLSGTAVGVVGFLMHRSSRVRLRRDAELLAEDMDLIHVVPVAPRRRRTPSPDDLLPDDVYWRNFGSASD